MCVSHVCEHVCTLLVWTRLDKVQVWKTTWPTWQSCFWECLTLNTQTWTFCKPFYFHTPTTAHLYFRLMIYRFWLHSWCKWYTTHPSRWMLFTFTLDFMHNLTIIINILKNNYEKKNTASITFLTTRSQHQPSMKLFTYSCTTKNSTLHKIDMNFNSVCSNHYVLDETLLHYFINVSFYLNMMWNWFTGMVDE